MISRYAAFAIAGALFVGACAEAPMPVEPTALSRHGGVAFNAAAAEGNTYLVRFTSNGIPADFASGVAALGGEVIFAHAGVGIAAVSGLTDAGADGLAARADVAGVDADMHTVLENPGELSAEGQPVGDKSNRGKKSEIASLPASPTAPATAFFFPRQWNMRQVQADQAWAAGKLGSSSIRVGILDTGLDPYHYDLVGRIDMAASRSFLSAAENARVTATWGPSEPLWSDLHYHGTHVGATVSSNAAVAAGVSSRTQLVAIKVCAPGNEANGFRGTCPTSGVLAGILYATDLGLPVINMSLGGLTLQRFLSARGGFGPSFQATINAVFHYAYRNGTQVVVASGNDGFDLQADFGNGLVGLYCDAPNVICVSATGPTSSTSSTAGPWFNPDAITSYSNTGKNHVTVAAPGGTAAGRVWAACSTRTIVTSLLVCRANGFAVGITGTSMASPHTAGLAAMIAAEGGHTPASITNRIIATSDDLGPAGKDADYGHGRINVFAGTR